MSQPELPGIPPLPLRRRIAALFTKRKLPAWAVLLFEAISIIPDWHHRVHFWLDAAHAAGGHLGMVAATIASPYFSLSLTAGAISWLLFAGEPKRGVLRDARWSYAAWAVVAAIFVVIVIVSIRGYIELRVREAIATSPLHISARRLNDQAKNCLKTDAPSMQDIENKKIVVGVVSGEREGMQYAGDFLAAFGETGLLNEVIHPKGADGTRFAVILQSNDPTMHGVYVGVPKAQDPPSRASIMKRLLSRCGVTAQIVGAAGSDDQTLIVIDQPP